MDRHYKLAPEPLSDEARAVLTGGRDRMIANATDYTLARAKRYQVTNRVTNQTYQASAFSADEACRKLGWLIGDCYVKVLSEDG